MITNTGPFYEHSEVFADESVDVDLEFTTETELIDIVVSCETAPTTSEKLTIKSATVNTAHTIDVEELQPDGEDLAIDGVAYGKKCFVYRFDKKFPKGTVVKIDYANTADHADDITVVARYIEQSHVNGTVIE